MLKERILISLIQLIDLYHQRKSSFKPDFGFSQVNQAGIWLLKKEYKLLSECYSNLRSDQKTALIEGLCMTKNYDYSIKKWVENEPSCSIAHLFNGALFTYKAWDARTGLRARYVTQKQAEGFFYFLELAYDSLRLSIELNDNEAEAYARMIRVLMGLSQPVELLYDYFSILKDKDPQHLYGHMYMLNALSQKWLGSDLIMMDFLEKVMPDIWKGSLLNLLIPMAHIEVWLNHYREDTQNEYFKRGSVQESIQNAYQNWIEGEPARSIFEPVLHNYFCFVFHWMGNQRAAQIERQYFGKYINFYPWGYESIFNLKDIDKYLRIPK
jgi:hypothetical protein